MACVVAPVFHKYVVPEVEVNVTLPPWQNVVGPPAEITGVAGKGLTVTIVPADDTVHPFAFVMITEYVPEEFTDIDCNVDPVLHK